MDGAMTPYPQLSGCNDNKSAVEEVMQLDMGTHRCNRNQDRLEASS